MARNARIRTKNEIVGFLERNQNAGGNVGVDTLMDAFYSSWDSTVNAGAVENVTTGSEAAASTNRESINATIAALSAAGGGTVYLPAGVYYVDGTGTASDGSILLKNNITLRGDGMGATIIRLVDSGNAKVSGVIRTESGVENSNIRVADLTIDGGAQTGTGDVICFYAGVTPSSSDRDTDIQLIRVEAINGYNGSDNAGYGFDPHEVVDRLTMVDCVAQNNDQDGFVIDGCENVTIRGCKSLNNGRHGFNFVTGSFDCTLLDCIAKGNGQGGTGTGVMVQNDAHRISVIGGVFATSADENIRVRGNGSVVETFVTIRGARIESSVADGLRITGAQYNIVQNCTFLNNGSGANNTHDDIQLDNDGANEGGSNFILNNTLIAQDTNKTRYAIREESDGGDTNVYMDNTCVGQVNSTAVSVSASSDSISRTFQGDNLRYSKSDTGTFNFQFNRGGGTFVTAITVNTDTGEVSFPNSTFGGGGATNITVTPGASTLTIASSSGTNGTFPAATTSEAGALTAADKTKLDGIEANATADQTGAEIKTAYEAEANTNAFTDAEKSKLAGVEANATADQTGAEIKAAYEAEANTNAFTDAEKSKLAGVEANATADQTGAEIKTAYEAEANTNAFTDALLAKLNAIDAAHYGAPVQNTTALTAIPQADLTDKERRFVEDAGHDYFYDATAGSGDLAPDDQAASTGFWKAMSGSAAMSAAAIKSSYESNPDTNAFTDAEKTKLTGIESNATADQTGAEIKTAYEAEADTNAFTDAEKAKLAAIEASATADQTDAEIETAYNAQVAQVSGAERTAGTATTIRRFAPADVKSMIDTHAASGGGGATASPTVEVQDVKGTADHGGPFTAGAWERRDLNTIITNVGSIATLGSNRITLPAGDYYLVAEAPAYRVNRSQVRIRDITNSVTLGTSPVAYGGTSTEVTLIVKATAKFTLAASAAIEIQHTCETTKATNGFGVSAGSLAVATSSVYTVVRIWAE